MMLADVNNSVLVCIDIQTKLAGAMPESSLASVLRSCGVLLQAAQALQVPVVATEQYPKGLGPTHTLVAQHFPGDLAPVEKTCFACNDAMPFIQQLERSGRKQVILTGMETHVCVLQTAAGLQAGGYDVFVVEDGVCSRAEINKGNALARMRSSGIAVTNTESVLFEWMRDAKHEQFRTVSALIR